MSGVLLSVLLLPTQAPLSLPPQAPARPPWRSPVAYPEGLRPFAGTKETQSLYILGSRHVVEKVSTDTLEAKWRTSGGLVGVRGWASAKYRLVPGGVATRLGWVSITNGLGYEQAARGLVRSYPDGARFDDVLSNSDGVVFEHRIREKKGGKWFSRVAYKDEAARPKGYAGLTVGCATCHMDNPGSGSYGKGLIPGGDTVFSDPLDWKVAGQLLRER